MPLSFDLGDDGLSRVTDPEGDPEARRTDPGPCRGALARPGAEGVADGHACSLPAPL